MRRCVTEGCDGRHCTECGGHIPFEIHGSVCDACIIERMSQAAETIYGQGTDEERQEAMKMWDI